MLLEEVMHRSFPWLPKEAWPNCANLNLYTEAWQSVGTNLRMLGVGCLGFNGLGGLSGDHVIFMSDG